VARGQFVAYYRVSTQGQVARSVAFISRIMEGDVEFVAVDMPMANRLTVHILAAVAEHEREMISQRTKSAPAA
jgi:DNA invertase Pin-like site-specific DNA recombinase